MSVSSRHAAVLLLLLMYAGRLGGAEPVELRGQTMGTRYSIKIAQARLSQEAIDRLHAGVEARLKEINRQMSHYQPDSEISIFNRGKTSQPVAVSPDFAEVVRFSLVLHQRSSGAFDPTLGPLIDIWGFSAKGTVLEPPSEAAIRAARAKTGARHLLVTPRGELQKLIPELELNLGGIAKGFAVDALARLLLESQLTNTLVKIAGEVAASGRNAHGEAWTIGITAPEPDGADDDFEAVAPLCGQAMSTSGNYRQFFVDEHGRRYGHILDPRTGAPAQHSLASVTVVADNCLTADGLATTLFVMGLERGLPWIETWTNAAALFIVSKPDSAFQHCPSSRFPRYTSRR